MGVRVDGDVRVNLDIRHLIVGGGNVHVRSGCAGCGLEEGGREGLGNLDWPIRRTDMAIGLPAC